jgi:molybdate transport system substrate-binding protein
MIGRRQFRYGGVVWGVLGLAVAAWFGGCSGVDPTEGARPKAEGKVTLHVAAASDLRAVLPVLIDRYKAKAPGVEVVATFGASGQLAEQVKAGAPFDLFLAANRAFARDLATEHYLDPDSVRPYAVGSLALVVSRDAGAGTAVSGLADLAKPEVKKVAIANPKTAPYGFAARQALERAGLWDRIEPKVVIAESVRQALQYVQTGNAEAGLVGRAISDVPEVRSLDIDPALYDPIEQNLGVVARSPNAEAAKAFAAFLVGDEAQGVFAAHGFKRP